MTDAAKRGKYKGICFSSPYASRAEEFTKFVLSARKSFIGCDLIFFTEVTHSGADSAELSDGAILRSESYLIDNEMSMLRNFCGSAESSKIFVTLPMRASAGEEHIKLSDARELCLRAGKSVEQYEGLLCGYEYTRYVRGKGETLSVRFPSLKYIKAKLECLAELGFMGIAVDICDTPTVIYAMFNALFARADHSGFQPI